MNRIYLGDQGELAIYLVEGGEIPADATPHTDVDIKGRPIIAHSEKGNHHVLERPVEVKYHAGMDTLYALLDAPMQLIQDCPDAHGSHTLPAGLIMFVPAQEYDPFAEQVRRVAD